MTGSFAAAFWTTTVLYALAVAALLFSHVFERPVWARRGTRLVGAALALHTLLVAWRWIVTGHVPVVGNFENALAGAWFIAAMTAWAAHRQRFPLLAAGALPLALVVLGIAAFAEPAPTPLVAALRSSWLYIHVFFAWLAYGAYTVACGAALVYLARTRAGRAPEPAALAQLDALMFRSTAFGFVTDAVMIAAGSIWAKDLWGSYWSWDPVETWSLLSWLVYGLALHLRRTLGWRGRRLAWVLACAIVGVLVSFWGVNLVMDGSAHVFNVD